MQPAPDMTWGQSNVACERGPVGPVESPRFRRPSLLRLLRLPKMALQTCVRRDFAQGRTSTWCRPVYSLQCGIRARQRRRPRQVAAGFGAVPPRWITTTTVCWPRARRTGCFDGAPLWGGQDWVPRGTPLSGLDRGQPLPSTSPPVGEPRASTHLLYPPLARVESHARAVGYPPGHLRGLAPLGLGPDQVRFNPRVVADARIRQRGDVPQRSPSDGHLNGHRRRPLLRRRPHRWQWLGGSASSGA